MKIHILGGPGSGKTTLGALLSKKFNIPHYDLDNFRYKAEDINYTLVEDDVVRDKKLKKVLSQKDWLTEGSYTNFAWPCFVEADIIIILKPRKIISDYRIIKRFLLHKLGIKKRAKVERWKSIVELLKWNREFLFNKLPPVIEKLKPFEHKIIHINSSKINLDELIIRMK